MTPRCPICRTARLLFLYEKYFCETCEVYFTQALALSSLPIENTFSHPEPCSMCFELKTRTVDCIHFKEYMERHVFCSVCKARLQGYLRYNFYKYFGLYRTRKRALSMAQALALVLLLCIACRLWVFRYPVLFFYEICHGPRYASLLKLPVALLTGETLSYPFLAVMAFCELTRSTEIYRVPAMLSGFDVEDHVGGLRIGAEKGPSLRKGAPYSPRTQESLPKKMHDRSLERKIRSLRI